MAMKKDNDSTSGYFKSIRITQTYIHEHEIDGLHRIHCLHKILGLQYMDATVPGGGRTPTTLQPRRIGLGVAVMFR